MENDGDHLAVILVVDREELVVIEVLADVIETEGHGELAVFVVDLAVIHFPGCPGDYRTYPAGAALGQIRLLGPTIPIVLKHGAPPDDTCQPV
jgi:hypothetical protein